MHGVKEFPYLLELTLATGAFVELTDEQRALDLHWQPQTIQDLSLQLRGQKRDFKV